MTSFIKILQIVKLKSKDNTKQILHAKFYASRVKNKRIRGGGGKEIHLLWFWSVFKSPVKIGLKLLRVKNCSGKKLAVFLYEMSIILFKSFLRRICLVKIEIRHLKRWPIHQILTKIKKDRNLEFLP